MGDLLEARLKKLLSRPIVVASHGDADGVSSAVLFSYAFVVKDVVFPDMFGDVDDSIDVVLDMRPRDPSYSNIVIDHHPEHPENRNYHLIWENVPTSLIVWKLVKDKISKNQWWKVVVGLCGDGAPELIPTEVWDTCPELFHEIVTQKSGRYGNFISRRPVWEMLSAPINFACRLKQVGPSFAYKLLRVAKSPMDIVYEDAFAVARETIMQEVNTIVSNLQVLDTGKILYGEIRSENKVEGLVAMKFTKPGRAVMIVNKETGNIALRGTLAMWAKEKLNARGWNFGGHPGWIGGNLENKSTRQLLNDILEISE